MYIYDCCFYPKSFDESYLEKFNECATNIVVSLERTGQILPYWQNTVKYAEHFTYRVVALEMDSLNPKYYNKYLKKFISELETISKKPPEFILIGESYDEDECCSCEKSNHYIIHVNHGSNTSPIICGDCFHAVPLYKFPKTYDSEEYYDLLGWQRLYKSCDCQFMKGIGERHGYKMISDYKSALSQEGLRIREFLETEAQTPFYYFLFKYYKKNNPTCPKCEKNWINKNSEFKFDYVCHNCRLVSDDCGV